jgi:probable rRNA maturation factor
MSISIDFTGFPKQYVPALLKAARAAVKNQKIKNGEINFIMVTDAEIKKLNIKYRKVRRITDVISFLVSPELFIGDIYISKGRSQKQAKRYNNTWEAELSYLVLHGILHLCGYTDYDPVNKAKMFGVQDRLFKCLY